MAQQTSPLWKLHIYDLAITCPLGSKINNVWSKIQNKDKSCFTKSIKLEKVYAKHPEYSSSYAQSLLRIYQDLKNNLKKLTPKPKRGKCKILLPKPKSEINLDECQMGYKILRGHPAFDIEFINNSISLAELIPLISNLLCSAYEYVVVSGVDVVPFNQELPSIGGAAVIFSNKHGIPIEFSLGSSNKTPCLAIDNHLNNPSSASLNHTKKISTWGKRCPTEINIADYIGNTGDSAKIIQLALGIYHTNHSKCSTAIDNLLLS